MEPQSVPTGVGGSPAHAAPEAGSAKTEAVGVQVVCVAMVVQDTVDGGSLLFMVNLPDQNTKCWCQRWRCL